MRLCFYTSVFVGAILFDHKPVFSNPLTRADWEQVENFRRWSNKPLFRRVFRAADVNRDRDITIEEIADYAEKELPRRATSENEVTLRIMYRQNPRSDLNRDGVLTKKELVTYLNWFVESS